MERWFEISINDGTGFMLTVDGEFSGYFDGTGSPIDPAEGTTVMVTKNDVKGPFDA